MTKHSVMKEDLERVLEECDYNTKVILNSMIDTVCYKDEWYYIIELKPIKDSGHPMTTDLDRGIGQLLRYFYEQRHLLKAFTYLVFDDGDPAQITYYNEMLEWYKLPIKIVRFNKENPKEFIRSLEPEY